MHKHTTYVEAIRFFQLMRQEARSGRLKLEVGFKFILKAYNIFRLQESVRSWLMGADGKTNLNNALGTSLVSLLYDN